MSEPFAQASLRSLLARILQLAALAALFATAAAWNGPANAGARAKAGMSAVGGTGYSYGYTGSSSGHAARDESEYAIIERGSKTTLSVSGDGDWSTIGDLQDEVRESGRPLLWFSLDARQYVVRDRALVGKARAIVEPINALGVEQGKLGAMQGELGRRQGELGRIQGRLGALEGRLAGMAPDLDPQERAEREALEREVHELSAQVGVIAREQREMGARQGDLGRRQGELGREQARAAKRATADLRTLAESAIADGKAEPVSE